MSTLQPDAKSLKQHQKNTYMYIIFFSQSSYFTAKELLFGGLRSMLFLSVRYIPLLLTTHYTFIHFQHFNQPLAIV